MISKKLQDALNEQIVAEIYSANLYLSMSFYMEKEGFEGFSTWMKKQSAEEMDHAYQMASFIIKRGGEAVVNQIPAVKQKWSTPLEAFEDTYKHECHVSQLIDKLLELAISEHDNASQDFLWQFVREQVEEEATASGIVDRIKRMGDSAIFNLDQQYGSRA
ncbi:ferritin [Hoylesella timonensis 4401737 = DSM 22865 = JCM 15640]|uniref:ferritin n=1 Tax=Prevotellaceae TaxID=171552 RepID=UPI0004233CEB|nr:MULTISPECIES: ferritin [Prevotellaceae]MCL6747637.1 ferritin [Prevotella sp. TCVGH]